ncbi:hypothetical protein GTY75_05305 [Streptomyces sp. SID8381]|uniref:hypothetical protein n=1 Tax=unclassified Streptomyces TaxID=2593676 RepID=UPI00035E0855|nr:MULTISPECIES: hypothetical protein [unclassified Streptomyces]MYX26091.1 hypothetical protein [Streptomyces sp. SID8381]
MSKIRIAIGAAVAAVLVLAGCAVKTSDPQPKPQDTYVSQFNNGFVDAKQDDCEQGFQLACEWLATSH